jgi:dTDP-4-dehydrorhamnose reductase
MGGNGMLGHQLCRLLPDRMDLWATFHEQVADFEFLPKERKLDHVPVQDITRVQEILDTVKPEVVVNAVGIVKQRDEAKQAVSSIQVNALFPHQLANLCIERGIRLVQLSTDCVFSGARGNYTEIDAPDAVDLYGRTKLIGEVNRPGCLTLRTSFIGWQLNTFSSLLSWFALQRGKRIKGYRKAIYSGFSTSVVARLIGDILETRPDLGGLYQVASKPISKYDILAQLRDILGWNDILIEPDNQFFCDRSLSVARFSAATGWQPPSWETMLQGLAEEWPCYASFYEKK